MSTADPTQAVLVYATAKGYVEAAKMVVDSPHYKGAHVEATFLPIHMLLGFAVELYLKAWLTKAGVSDQELKSHGLRHNLMALHARAQTEGLPVKKSWAELIDHLGPGHADFSYRYAKAGGTYQKTNLTLAFSILSELDDVVDAKVGASAWQGLPVGH